MCRPSKMFMLLSVHMTNFLFLVRFTNFALTMGFYWSYMLLLLLLMHSCYKLELHTLTLTSYVFLVITCNISLLLLVLMHSCYNIFPQSDTLFWLFMCVATTLGQCQLF